MDPAATWKRMVSKRPAYSATVQHAPPDENAPHFVPVRTALPADAHKGPHRPQRDRDGNLRLEVDVTI
ncbi:hypothetical protein KIN20_037941 [Parelaphostrongylus tenuis]|uniref:Uncharacterized protein n=1 Tax=Parelaphostrongylus tenuis TaxID=148309 RepID=A0AAD5WLA4_PARTN|nr:hypothetical protein KIN20_037941 [Parelaphostrongylus tenuis]